MCVELYKVSMRSKERENEVSTKLVEQPTEGTMRNHSKRAIFQGSLKRKEKQEHE